MQTNTPNPRLLDAAKKGEIKTIRTLLALEETKVNACDSEGMTALHFAANNGHIKIVKFLIANGAEVNAENNYGATPIALAARECHVDVAKALLLHAEKNEAIITRNNNMALFYAVQNRHTKMVELLLERGANANAQTREILLETRVNANMQNEYDESTPIIFAVQNGHTEMVQLLIRSGADANA